MKRRFRHLTLVHEPELGLIKLPLVAPDCGSAIPTWWSVGGRLRGPQRVDTPLREPSPSFPRQQAGGMLVSRLFLLNCRTQNAGCWLLMMALQVAAWIGFAKL